MVQSNTNDTTQSNNKPIEEEKRNDNDTITTDTKPKSTQKTVKSDLTAEDIALRDQLESYVYVILDINNENQSLNTDKTKHDSLVQPALENIAKSIRESTGSMTALPRPLKFLRSHYKSLKSYYNEHYIDNSESNDGLLNQAVNAVKHAVMGNNVTAQLFADILSVLAMTAQSDIKNRESLHYKLLGNQSLTIDYWGHEYVRHLSGEVGSAYNDRLENNEPTDELIILVNQIVPFFLSTSAEYDAVDLLIETDKINELTDQTAADSYDRICKYILRCTDYIPDQADLKQLLTVTYNIYVKHNAYTDALRIAIKTNDKSLMYNVFEQCNDELTRKQLGLMLGQHKIVLDELRDDDELMELIGNTKLNGYFQQLAIDLDVKEAKSPDDIYKSWLEEGAPNQRRGATAARSAPTAASGVDSAKQNLASTFVNAFVNCGFGKDTLITPEGSDWLYKNKSHGMLSATASLGLIMLWDVETGFSVVDKYSFSAQNYIKAGSALAHGILSSGITSDMDAAQALLSEHIDSTDVDLKISAILGLGIAYAGTAREDILEMLVPKIIDAESSIEVVSTTCLALGLVYCGTGNDDISGSMIEAFLDCTTTDLNDSVARFMCVGIGLLFLGQSDATEGTLAALDAIEHPINKYLKLTVEICAYAGTGNVLCIQKLLTVAAEHLEDDENNPLKTSYQDVAVLGIAVVALGEELATEMALRSLDHILQYGEVNIKRVVPLSLGLLSISNPRLTVLDTLSKLSHDQDQQVSQNAVLAMGFIGAGTNNARIATILRNLASYYAKEANHLFLVRIAQGLLHTGKGLMTLSPIQSDGFIIDKISMCGLLTVFHACLDLKNTILGKRHYILYTLACTVRPRMLMTLDEKLNPLPVSVRVGQRVDTVGVAGKPKTITGFQTHNTPVLLAAGERAELSTDEYIPCSNVLEGLVILKKNPDYSAA